MAGTIFARELAPARAGRVEFTVATRADDADLRRLLRENPMAGAVRLSLEREPDFFAGFGGAEQQTIVARERGRLACAGWCGFRERFVNGVPRRVGYLGGLRLAGEFAGRGEVVRRGYEFFGELQRERPAAGYFTSIAADNERALRLLERGLPGWPRYAWLADFVTVLVPVAGSRSREEVARAGNPPANVRWQKGTAGVSPRVGTGGETPPELAGEDACGTPTSPARSPRTAPVRWPQAAPFRRSGSPHVGGYGGGAARGRSAFSRRRRRGWRNRSPKGVGAQMFAA